jgi:hypothetical protein
LHESLASLIPWFSCLFLLELSTSVCKEYLQKMEAYIDISQVEWIKKKAIKLIGELNVNDKIGSRGQ